MEHPRVVAVSRHGRHRFSKVAVDAVELVAGHGVAGDAHAGATVQHLSRKRWTPDLPNLRQVHLLPVELFNDVRALGLDLAAGELGENVLTAGLDLHALPTGTRLHLGEAVVRLTGLRNPCVQIDRFRPGLLKAVLFRADDGTPADEPVRGNSRQVIRRAGVMSVVEVGGVVAPGQAVEVELPPGPAEPLQPV